MKRVVITWGRFNPPTIGHEKLFNKVKEIAGQDDYFIYPTHTQKVPTDPLNHQQKCDALKNMFPHYKNNIVQDSNLNTIIKVLQSLQGTYHDCVLVLGGDQIVPFEFTRKRNGIDYTFRNFEIESAGERNPDAKGATGMSATKMRAAAVQSDFNAFRSGIPKTVNDNDCKKFMNLIRDIMLK